MAKTILAALFIFSTFGSVEDSKINHDFDPAILSGVGRAAYASLKEARQFEDANVGFAGSLSTYAGNLETLLNEQFAPAAFRSLLKNGTTAGKLYALCGLYYADYEAFEKEIASFRNSKETVDVMSGCEIYPESVAKLVESDAPNVAIIGSGETLEQFLAGNGGRGFSIDIAHGGYQATFRHYVKKEKESNY